MDLTDREKRVAVDALLERDTCPNCDGKLMTTRSEGITTVYCFDGCSNPAICAALDLHPTDLVDPDDPEYREPAPEVTTTLGELAASISDQVIEPLIHGLAWRGRISLLSARAKRGKSTLVAQAAAMASNGEAFLDEELEAIRILYFAPDENPADTISKLRTYRANEETIRMKAIEAVAGIYELIADVEDRIDLIIVDSFIELVRLETGRIEENDAQISDHLRRLAALSHTGKYGVLVIAHGGHDGDRPRGSSAILGVVDQVIVMESPDDNWEENPVRTLKYSGRWSEPDKEIAYGFQGYMPTTEMTDADRIIIAISTEPGIKRNALQKKVGIRKSAVLKEVTVQIALGNIIDDDGLYAK